MFYMNLGRYADAEPLYKRALASKTKALGPHHPEVTDTLKNLGILSARSGNNENALAYSRKATDLSRLLGVLRGRRGKDDEVTRRRLPRANGQTEWRDGQADAA